MKAARFLRIGLANLTLTLGLASSLGANGCGGSEGAADDGATDARRGPPALEAPLRPAASCEVVIESPALVAGDHVPEGTTLTFATNPPSSGAHFPVWANYQEFEAPVPAGYLVHSLEHGGVALLYKCEGPCPEVVEALRKVREGMSFDPLCGRDTKTRVIIAPAPDLDVPVAAVSWGWTYKAQCVDPTTLAQFAKEHYAFGPEDTCAPGRATF